MIAQVRNVPNMPNTTLSTLALASGRIGSIDPESMRDCLDIDVSHVY